MEIKLSVEEQLTLRMILGLIGGCPDKSIRKHAATLLEKLGPNFYNYGYALDWTDHRGRVIYFHDRSLEELESLIEDTKCEAP